MKVGDFYISPGNIKVQFPLVNVGAALDCPSAKWCPFSKGNYKKAGRNLCYAQRTEILRPNVLKSRRINASLIKDGKVSATDVADTIAKHFDKRGAPYGRIVRLNESSDLSAENINWVVSLINELNTRGIKVYLYSKAPQVIQDLARAAGATVLHSERDFIAVKNTADTELPICPGICGPCLRCPLGMRSAILEH